MGLADIPQISYLSNFFELNSCLYSYMSNAKQNNVRYSDGSISYFTNTAVQNVI